MMFSQYGSGIQLCQFIRYSIMIQLCQIFEEWLAFYIPGMKRLISLHHVPPVRQRRLPPGLVGPPGLPRVLVHAPRSGGGPGGGAKGYSSTPPPQPNAPGYPQGYPPKEDFSQGNAFSHKFNLEKHIECEVCGKLFRYGQVSGY